MDILIVFPIILDIRIQISNNPGKLIRFRCPGRGAGYNNILNPSRNKNREPIGSLLLQRDK
jgi:hypothetical protein